MVTGLAREFATAGKLFESGQAPPRLLHVVEETTAIVPMGRPGNPAEVAAAVARLAGADGRFISGQTIYVKRGSTMG